MPNQASAPESVPGAQQSNSVQGTNVEAGPPSANQGAAFHDSTNYGAPPGMPVWAPHGMVCYTAVFRVVTQRSSPLGALRDDTKNCCL